MNRLKRVTLGVTALEGRTVLSAAMGVAPVHVTKELNLQGSAHGLPSTIVGNPVVGTTVMLHGSGQVSPLGTVKVSGALHGTGFLASSHVEGTLTLSSPQGSLTLQVQSPKTGGFTAPSSGAFHFTILKGTGSLSHDAGNGTVALTLSPKSFQLTFQP